jgi:dihydrofolate reductase
VLGGAAVHDWFLDRDLIDRIELTIEPLRFGTGLPLLTGQSGDPVVALSDRSFALADERRLNARGTRLLLLTRRRE